MIDMNIKYKGFSACNFVREVGVSACKERLGVRCQLLMLTYVHGRDLVWRG